MDHTKIKHRLRKHAAIRISQRSITDVQEILQRINKEAFVPLGVERGGRRSHELLYLPDDSIWFTIIRYLNNQEIVTFLPVDYHNKCGWMISEEALDSAKKIGEEFTLNITPKNKNNGQTNRKSVYVFSAILETEDGWTKSISLGKYRIEPDKLVDGIRSDSVLKRTILGRISKEQIELETIKGLVVLRKNGSEAIFLPGEKWLASES